MQNGRVAVDDQIVRLVKENFVCTTINYAYARMGAEAEFITAIGSYGNGGFVIATAGGKVLVKGSAGHWSTVLQGWEKWKSLPEAERKPGAIKINDEVDKVINLASGFAPKPPPGGLIIRVCTRGLKRDARGELARITEHDLKDQSKYPGRWRKSYTEPMPDVLWLTEGEWKSLVPAHPRKGDTFPVPDRIQKRVFRFNLVDGTKGMFFRWSASHIRYGKLTLTVEEVAPVIRLRVQGAALMTSAPKEYKGEIGYEASLLGFLEYDARKKVFTRFDFVALGDWWSPKGLFADDVFRPGRTALGVAFELGNGDRAADFVSPRGLNFRTLSNYFAAEKD